MVTTLLTGGMGVDDGGDIDLIDSQDGGEVADDTQAVIVVDDDSRIASGEFGSGAVDVDDFDVAAADRGTGQGGHLSVGGVGSDAHCVWVDVTEVSSFKLDLYAFFFGNLQRIFDLRVIGIHAEYAADQRTVGAVSAQGQVEGAVQNKVDRFELLVCNHVVHGFTDALCAGGM